jgi:hypothetical protein
MSCLAKDRNQEPCRNKGPFCKFHSYMKDYTEEMMTASVICSGCNKMKYTGGNLICEACRLRSEDVRKKKKEDIILCAKEKCAFKKSKENKYCGKHQLCVFLDSTAELGLKPCANSGRGCREQLPIDDFSRCKTCLEFDRKKDHVKRSVDLVKNTHEKQCSVCAKMYPLDAYNGKHGETKTCNHCREANKRADEKRDIEHTRELARKNESKPERREVKTAWNEENYEKVAGYWMNARQRELAADVEAYQKKNAEQAKKWRDKNPEKVKIQNAKNINVDSYYGVYRKCAKTKQLQFELTKEDYLKMATQNCFYCGTMQPKGFNGIDRKDSTKGYVVDNCVSCCEMCNFMKKCLSVDIFIQNVKHISVFNKRMDGSLYPESFKNVNHVSHSEYITSAKKRTIQFELSKEYFDEKRKNPCYLCGKENAGTHQNGLDRVDSSIGYIESNVQSCCGSCNMLKNNYSLVSFLEKCLHISLHHKEVVIVEQPEIRGIVQTRPKMTAEEKREKERIRKQKQREGLRERYGDEEYKKMRAQTIAEERRRKREAETKV